MDRLKQGLRNICPLLNTTKKRAGKKTHTHQAQKMKVIFTGQKLGPLLVLFLVTSLKKTPNLEGAAVRVSGTAPTKNAKLMTCPPAFERGYVFFSKPCEKLLPSFELTHK